MFKNKTVFIVGAGASREAGLPDGRELADKISESLSFKFEGGELTSGNIKIYQDFKNNLKPGEATGEYFKAGNQISNGIFLAETIDNYIDTHRHNPLISLCGKTAIVHAILEGEKDSLLHLNSYEGETILDQKKLKDTWYVEFAKILFKGVTVEKIDSVFDNIAIICFNYDRCIQQYLIYAIASHFFIPISDAQNILKKLKIYQPYGSVGSIYQNNSHFVPFGQNPQNADLIGLTKSIRTYTEQVEDEIVIQSIQNEIFNAETFVFLGFAFHPQNLQLLKISSPNQPHNFSKRIFATAYRLSDYVCGILKSKIPSYIGVSTICPPNMESPPIQFRKDLKCAKLFSEFNYSLAAD